MSSSTPQRPNDSGERYETLRLLGQGGAGAVYLARDRETGGLVALKKLLRVDPKSVLRLKREFRSLADMRHPNLVQLYELESSDDAWFLTMEYIDGADLLTHVRSLSGAEQTTDETRDMKVASATSPASLDVDPILGVFLQLASGIRALHRAGMLHRDLKPSNVLVAQDRVVVLDFGLVLGMDASSIRVTHDGTIAGTPAYMAPEQALSQPLGEAADWYAFGVMLFQALAGELPIEGRTATELVVRKTTSDARPIERVVSGLPKGLVALCNQLLMREPQLRPTGDQIVDALDALLGQPITETKNAPLDLSLTTQLSGQSLRAPSELVGRTGELAQLSAALDEAREGRPVIVHVRGTSGAGKTALVERFLLGLEEASPHFLEAPLVLKSRCTEREAMPYKALDGVMDGVVQYLIGLDDFSIGRVLPADVADLARLFPAMERVSGARRLLASSRSRADRVQARIAGEAAMREMFARLAQRRLVAIWIDDLQWGDLDSVRILKTWQEQLAASPALLIFTYRSDEVATSPALREILEPRPRPQPAAARILDLAPLDELQARELCSQKLGAVARERPDLVAKIASESQGNPFFASQLAALVQAKVARGDAALDALSIEQLIAQATQMLAPEAMRILNVLAVAGRPLPPKLALRAAGVENAGRAHLHALRGLRLIRARSVGHAQLIEPYHDRVREAVVASLDPELRPSLQASLVRALEQAPNSDSGWLFALALEAALPEAALRHGLAAAEHAESVFAFERAAELFERCIELRERAGEETGSLQRKLGDCLARAGHGGRAAEAYLAAAKHAQPSEAVKLQRMAASHLLRSGEYERGNQLVHEVLHAHGLHIPQSDAGVIAAVAWERARAGLRSLGFTPRDDVPREKLDEIELYLTLAIEYQAYDPVRTALFQARALRLALASGSRYEIAFAMGMAAVVTCVNGSEKAARDTDDLLARAEAIAAELQDESLRGDILAAKAIAGYMLGRFNQIVEPSYEAERIYRNTPSREDGGAYYHRFVAVAVRIGGHFMCGDYAKGFAELARSSEEARATNNRSAILQLSLVQTVADGLRDDYASAKVRLEQERKLLPHDRFGPLHTLHLISLFRVACGLDDYAWAADWIEEDWNKWKHSLMRMSAFMSLLTIGGRMRYVVNRHVVERRSDDVEKLLRWEMKAAKSIPLEEAQLGLPLRTKARFEFLAGRRDAAIANLRKMSEFLEKVGARGEAERENLAIALMREGRAGPITREWEQRMRESGVVNPLHEVYACYPELRES